MYHLDLQIITEYIFYIVTCFANVDNEYKIVCPYISNHISFSNPRKYFDSD